MIDCDGKGSRRLKSLLLFPYALFDGKLHNGTYGLYYHKKYIGKE